MIDLHCHLDLYPQPRALVAECIDRQLYVLSVTTVPSAFEGTAALASPRSRIRTALGLHPEVAAARIHELPLFERLLPRTRYVGEVGLDGSQDHRKTLDIQRDILGEILRLCARAGGKVLSLHSRGAASLVLDSLEQHSQAGYPVLHWYIASPRQVARAAEMGCWFSIGPSMMASERGRLAAQAMPRDRILPESDGPFGWVDGRPANPWDAWSIVPLLSQMWRDDEHAVIHQLRINFRKLVDSETLT